MEKIDAQFRYRLSLDELQNMPRARYNSDASENPFWRIKDFHSERVWVVSCDGFGDYTFWKPIVVIPAMVTFVNRELVSEALRLARAI